MEDFVLQESSDWFHVKSEWQKNYEISTLSREKRKHFTFCCTFSKSQMEHPVWNTVWNFIVIISPFYHINKKVRLHFFAIKIQSFHAALNSDAEEEVGPNLESMAWKFSHFLRFFPKIIKVLWNAPYSYSTTFIQR